MNTINDTKMNTKYTNIQIDTNTNTKYYCLRGGGGRQGVMFGKTNTINDTNPNTIKDTNPNTINDTNTNRNRRRNTIV